MKGGDEMNDDSNWIELSPEQRSPKPKALQIVSVGTEEDEYAFTYHKDNLQIVVNKIPTLKQQQYKVAVVSVVGAFRTGKSFLLSWFLRYLYCHYETASTRKTSGTTAGGKSKKCGSQNEEGEEKKCTDDKKLQDEIDVPPPLMSEEGESVGDNCDASEKPWYETFDSLGQEAFHWRGGAERNTSGIWVWSEPFIMPLRKNRKYGSPRDTKESTGDDEEMEDVAVLLVDTQGMFDHETTMKVTASIFGLSTLLSSYQIYNVDKRIQEDNLQQLALFSEYGRIALYKEEPDKGRRREKMNGEMAPGKTRTKVRDGGNDIGDTEDSNEAQPQQSQPEVIKVKPFQRMEFLVRDWQNFEHDEDDVNAMIKEMAPYLNLVLEERNANDLKETREQITSSFETLSCFMMTHPGFAVTKKKYTGEVNVIESTFLKLLDAYCHRVFNPINLQPKVIHGRQLTAMELEAYIHSYATMFEKGANFPEAQTMLDATAAANNANATTLAITKYRGEMDRVAGPNCSSYLRPALLEKEHDKYRQSSMSVFDDMTDFGSQRSIDKARAAVVEEIHGSFSMYASLNESRNPLMGFETYVVPMTIAIIAFSLRFLADNTCSSWSQTCRASSEVLSQVYAVVFLFLLIVASTKMKLISKRVSQIKKALA